MTADNFTSLALANPVSTLEEIHSHSPQIYAIASGLRTIGDLLTNVEEGHQGFEEVGQYRAGLAYAVLALGNSLDRLWDEIGYEIHPYVARAEKAREADREGVPHESV